MEVAHAVAWGHACWIKGSYGFLKNRNDKLSELKFIYSEKGTKFCKIFTLLLAYVVPVKSKVEISQNFAAVSEYMNFTKVLLSKPA